jgi:hypothetical protein
MYIHRIAHPNLLVSRGRELASPVVGKAYAEVDGPARGQFRDPGSAVDLMLNEAGGDQRAQG